jgi:diguanylate cyclase (GGDEF)-like protein
MNPGLGIPSRLDRLLRGSPRPLLVAMAVAGILLLGLCDHWSGGELSFSIFYLAPLLLLAWYARPAETYGCALLAALVWMVAEITDRSYQQPLVPYWNMLVRLGFFLLVGNLVLRVKGLLARQRSLAETDSLTGLLNARIFYRRLEDEARRAVRYRRPFTLACLDLDNFKRINDTQGHATGDRLLQTVGGELQRLLRNTDTAARLGGDEFALLLPETGYAEAGEALRKVRRELLTAMHDQEWAVTCSIGAVTFTRVENDLAAMVGAADDLMYQAKRAGKDRLLHRQRGDKEATKRQPGANGADGGGG